MNVLKNFGLSLFTLLAASQVIFAQNVSPVIKVDSNTVPLRIESNQFVKKFLPAFVTTSNNTPTTKNADQDIYTSRLVKKEASTKKSSTTNVADGMMSWLKDKYSSMINVMPNQLSNVMLYSFIDDWYGTKYRMGGTSKKGVDCSAFVQNMYKYVFGINIVRTAALQFNASKHISNIADLREGDLVFFRVNTSRISHVGVYLNNNYFVHSASSKGVSIANLNNAYWSRYFAGGGRILEN